MLKKIWLKFISLFIEECFACESAQHLGKDPYGWYGLQDYCHYCRGTHWQWRKWVYPCYLIETWLCRRRTNKIVGKYSGDELRIILMAEAIKNQRKDYPLSSFPECYVLFSRNPSYDHAGRRW